MIFLYIFKFTCFLNAYGVDEIVGLWRLILLKIWRFCFLKIDFKNMSRLEQATSKSFWNDFRISFSIASIFIALKACRLVSKRVFRVAKMRTIFETLSERIFLTWTTFLGLEIDRHFKNAWCFFNYNFLMMSWIEAYFFKRLRLSASILDFHFLKAIWSDNFGVLRF